MGRGRAVSASDGLDGADVDTAAVRGILPDGMRFLRPASMLLLLAVWLTATVHCRLEAAGWLPDQCPADCGEPSGKGDGCEVVETASYKQAADQLHVAPPAGGDCLLLLVSLPVEMEDRAAPLELSRFAEERTLVRTWQFFERAAPPCRAPSLRV